MKSGVCLYKWPAYIKDRKNVILDVRNVPVNDNTEEESAPPTCVYFYVKQGLSDKLDLFSSSQVCFATLLAQFTLFCTAPDTYDEEIMAPSLFLIMTLV